MIRRFREGTAWRRFGLAAGLAMVAMMAATITGAVQIAEAAAGDSSLSAGQELQAGQDLVSPGGQYILSMQTDGNLVVYGNGCVIWASNTGGTGSSNYLAMQGDGNLVIYTSAGKPVWASNTGGTGSGNNLNMQVDGNLVVYTSAPKPVWASGAGAADQLCAPHSLGLGQYIHSSDGQYKLLMQDDGNLVLYGPNGATWASNTVGAGGTSVNMQSDGNLVIYTSSGSPVWSSNTAPSSNDRLVVQTDGNLVIYSGSSALWAKGQLLTGLPGPYNAGIITHANAYPTGSYGGQCLAWVANIVKAAGGPTIAFGYNAATYQSQWAKIASQVSWANVRPGDIVQFVTSSNEHTLIITGGNTPSTATVVDSNFGRPGLLVSRGSFASRAAGFNNANYIIWRIHS